MNLRKACFIGSLVLALVELKATGQSTNQALPLGGLVTALAESDDPQFHLDVLRGMSAGLQGRRSAPMPAGWETAADKMKQSPNTEVRTLAKSLSLTFGSTNALAELRASLASAQESVAVRRSALESLLSAKDPGLAPVLQRLLSDSDLRGPAVRGLAAYDHPETPAKILAAYPSFDAATKRDALNAMASRVPYARSMLAAVGEGRIARRELTADLIRQLRSLKNDEINQHLEKVWGAVRESSADKQQQIERYRKVYRAGGSQPGDASRGRAVFARICQQCHTLFDVGAAVGPDLTGSNRGDLDYILQNMVDPNAVIPHDYRSSTLETKDDRVITGIVKSEDANSVNILTATESITIPRAEVASLKQNELSMMPEGLLDPLSEQEVRDLIYYLSRPGQVPLPTGTAATP